MSGRILKMTAAASRLLHLAAPHALHRALLNLGLLKHHSHGHQQCPLLYHRALQKANHSCLLTPLEVSHSCNSSSTTRDLADTFNSFPATNQPVSESTLKDMLGSLRASLHADLMEYGSNFKSEVQKQGGRVDHIEHKMGEFAASHNTLIDAHNEQDDEMEKLKTKIAVLEDRSRWNNVKLRGVPESVLNAQLNQYVCDIIRAVLPSIPISEIIIDRIHCLPKPAYLPDDIHPP